MRLIATWLINCHSECWGRTHPPAPSLACRSPAAKALWRRHAGWLMKRGGAYELTQPSPEALADKAPGLLSYKRGGSLLVIPRSATGNSSGCGIFSNLKFRADYAARGGSEKSFSNSPGARLRPCGVVGLLCVSAGAGRATSKVRQPYKPCRPQALMGRTTLTASARQAYAQSAKNSKP